MVWLRAWCWFQNLINNELHIIMDSCTRGRARKIVYAYETWLLSHGGLHILTILDATFLKGHRICMLLSTMSQILSKDWVIL